MALGTSSCCFPGVPQECGAFLGPSTAFQGQLPSRLDSAHRLLSTLNSVPSWEWSIRRWDVCVCVVHPGWGGEFHSFVPNPYGNRSPWHFLCPCLSSCSFNVQGSQAWPHTKQGKRAALVASFPCWTYPPPRRADRGTLAYLVRWGSGELENIATGTSRSPFPQCPMSPT